MNWNNVDLDSPSEAGANLIDPLTFDGLLLEIDCNLRVINRDSVRHQFELDCKQRMDEAYDVFEANLNNIVNKALKNRAGK